MCYRESCGGDLFDCLTAPSLKELALSWYTEDSYQDLSTRLISFQARSAPNKLSSIELRVFNATDAGEHFENLILALRAFPAVESFFLADSYPSGWDILFQGMTCLNGRLDVLFSQTYDTIIDIELPWDDGISSEVECNDTFPTAAIERGAFGRSKQWSDGGKAAAEAHSESKGSWNVFIERCRISIRAWTGCQYVQLLGRQFLGLKSLRSTPKLFPLN
ncbi:hypothetical protein BDP27DRAFT_556058 [Rhodocollybia butyracea]|uniref:Uncharacterized protein n=1 Tax=Rhodocollybia butyracea TaxID=206335 RepID=A0A9P5PAV8_9AGAR|nr:hypothetical protein BDP27DRAFT_556058 [Rhodocollybia butyracea]